MYLYLYEYICIYVYIYIHLCKTTLQFTLHTFTPQHALLRFQTLAQGLKGPSSSRVILLYNLTAQHTIHHAQHTPHHTQHSTHNTRHTHTPVANRWRSVSEVHHSHLSLLQKKTTRHTRHNVHCTTHNSQRTTYAHTHTHTHTPDAHC